MISGSISTIQTLEGSIGAVLDITGELSSSGQLSGEISSAGTLVGSLSSSQGLTGKLTIPSAIGVEVYDGEYEVTPKMFEGQTLATKNKLMEDDVVVLEVPYYEVDNTSGGTTVYICTEV